MREFLAVVCLIFGMIGPATNSFALPAERSSKPSMLLSPDVPAFSIQTEQMLQTPISLEETDRPLGDLLNDLSRKLDVSLATVPNTEDQRVTLHLVAQPLYQVMTRLCGLLSHSPSAPQGYAWTTEISVGGVSRPVYRLVRDSHSLSEEAAALDSPRRKAVALLRDLRNLAPMNAEQRSKHKSDLPVGYLEDPEIKAFQKALAGASDKQIDALVENGTLALDPVRFAAEIAHFNKSWHAAAVRQRQSLRSQSGRDPSPGGVPSAPPEPAVVSFHWNDEQGEHPEGAVDFVLGLRGIQMAADLPPGYAESHNIGISPLRKLQPPFPTTARAGEPVIDLTPFLRRAGVTPEQRGDVGFTLQMLAKASGISLYQEEFFKTGFRGGRPRGLWRMKGTVAQLLNTICAIWQYDAQKVGNDYFLWSSTWAQDRLYDVSDRLIVRWRDRFQKQNGFTLNDRIEIAGALTWPQLFLTLKMALPESGPWDGRRDAETLRFLGGFSTPEREVMAGIGLPIASISASQRTALFNTLRKDAPQLLEADILRARLLLKPDLIWEAEGRKRTDLTLKSETFATLWAAQISFQAVGNQR